MHKFRFNNYIMIILLLIVFGNISIVAYPVHSVFISSYSSTEHTPYLWETVAIILLTAAVVLPWVFGVWQQRHDFNESAKKLLMELGMDEDEIANLKFDKKTLKEFENISPGERLAIVLLSEGERLNAASFVLDKNGDNDEIIVKYECGEKWEELPRPPASIWSLIYNVYMLWAGLDYFKPGIQKGHIKYDELNWQWDFEVNETHDKIVFKPIKEEKSVAE